MNPSQQSAAGAFYFTGLQTFAIDKPYEQTMNVTPATGVPAAVETNFSFDESGFFAQDDWKATRRLTLTLGIRHDYFGDPSERRSLLSSITLGPGSTFDQQFASATVGHVSHLFHAPLNNFSPRVGLAYDPFGDGKSTIRAGFSLAYEPIHARTVLGGSSNPPNAIQAVIWPADGYGTTIDYAIPVPVNPEFKTTFNAQGGVVSLLASHQSASPVAHRSKAQDPIQREPVPECSARDCPGLDSGTWICRNHRRRPRETRRCQSLHRR